MRPLDLVELSGLVSGVEDSNGGHDGDADRLERVEGVELGGRRRGAGDEEEDAGGCGDGPPPLPYACMLESRFSYVSGKEQRHPSSFQAPQKNWPNGYVLNQLKSVVSVPPEV